jgi:hypothetical protein
MWSPVSENYFWEIKQALEAENLAQIENVLEKYGVDYLVLDRSIVPIVTSIKALSNDRVKELLSQSTKVKFEKQFDFIEIYKFSHDKQMSGFSYAPTYLPSVGPEIQITNFDSAYQTLGDYVTEKNGNVDVYYPFLDFSTQTDLEANWKITETESSWLITTTLTDEVKNLKDEDLIGTSEFLYQNQNGEIVSYILPYTLTTRGKFLTAEFPKIAVNSFRADLAQIKPCITKGGQGSATVVDGKLEIESAGGNYTCIYFENLTLPQRYGYLLKVMNSNTSGQRLFFYVKDQTKEQSYMEDRLTNDTEYYILGQRFEYGLGYSFAFQASSNKTISSKNQLEGVDVYLMPYDILKNLSYGTIDKTATFTDGFEVTKENYYTYTAKIFDPDAKFVVLNQAYQDGWGAYVVNNSNFLSRSFPFLGKKLNHVKINNWANGWELEESSIRKPNESIVIIYWPQHLEYVGFALLFALFVYLLSPAKAFGRLRIPTTNVFGAIPEEKYVEISRKRGTERAYNN